MISKNRLLMPINSIHSIGGVVANKIIKERANGKFSSFMDFKKRMGSEVDSRMLENLINAGFFDSLGESHKLLLTKIDSDFDGYISEEESLSNVGELDFETLRENEFSALGFNLKYDIFVGYDSLFIQYRATMPNELVVDKKVNVIGQIKRIKTIQTKKGDQMAFVTLDCNHQLLDVVVFSEAYNEYSSVLTSKKLVLFNGVVRKREDNLQVQLFKAKEL